MSHTHPSHPKSRSVIASIFRSISLDRLRHHHSIPVPESSSPIAQFLNPSLPYHSTFQGSSSVGARKKTKTHLQKSPERTSAECDTQANPEGHMRIAVVPVQQRQAAPNKWKMARANAKLTPEEPSQGRSPVRSYNACPTHYS